MFFREGHYFLDIQYLSKLWIHVEPVPREERGWGPSLLHRQKCGSGLFLMGRYWIRISNPDTILHVLNGLALFFLDSVRVFKVHSTYINGRSETEYDAQVWSEIETLICSRYLLTSSTPR